MKSLFQGTAFSIISMQGHSVQKITQWSKWPQRLETAFLPYCIEGFNIIGLNFQNMQNSEFLNSHEATKVRALCEKVLRHSLSS